MATRSRKKREAAEEKLRLVTQTRRRVTDCEAAARRARAETENGPDRRDLTFDEQDEEAREVFRRNRPDVQARGFEDR